MEQKKKYRFTNLSQFDAENSPSGLLRRYSVGRTRSLITRIYMALIGCVVLFVMLSPSMGLLAACVTIPLEMLEYIVLKRVIALGKFESKRIHWMVSLASFLQVSGLGVCIIIAGIQTDPLRMLAWVYLLGAVLNSILTARFHPPSHMVRMVVLCGVAVTIVLQQAFFGMLTGPEFITELTALISMSMMMFYLHRHMSKRRERVYQAERALLERSEEAFHLALVAEHATDSVVIMDAQQTITWVNKQFSLLTGYSFDEAIGKAPGELLNHPDTSPETIAKFIRASKAGVSIKLRVLNKTKSGMRIWVESNQTPVRGEDGKISAFIAVERDVSDEVAYEAALEKALIAAKQADREKVAFLSRMSHELRTPANGLIGGIELLLETEQCRDQKEAIGILETSADRLMELVDNIVTVTDANSEQVRVSTEPMQIKPMFEKLIHEYRGMLRDKPVRLDYEVHSSAEVIFNSDPKLIGLVLEKLLANAVKFTNDGAIVLSAKVETDVLLLEVADTGIGIPSEKMGALFEAFGQVDEDTTRSFDGAGLGLVSAEKLVKLLHGRISVRSELGQGSRFTVHLPFDADDSLGKTAGALPEDGGSGIEEQLDGAEIRVEDTNQKAGQAFAAIEPGMSTKRFLIAEDNRTNRFLLQTMLKGSGHDLVFAENGQQAVDAYSVTQPDFVLMDLAMPIKDGWDATRDIRAIERNNKLPRCPIVAVTANVSDEEKRKCVEVGMDAFLAKPLRKDRLLKTIKEVSFCARAC